MNFQHDLILNLYRRIIMLREAFKNMLLRRKKLFGFFLFFLLIYLILTVRSAYHYHQFQYGDDNDPLIIPRRQLKIYNDLGNRSSTLERSHNDLNDLIKLENLQVVRDAVWYDTSRAREIYQEYLDDKPTIRLFSGRPRIVVATVVCGGGDTELEARTMLKSVVMFSRDADLHVIVYGDDKLPPIGGWDFLEEEDALIYMDSDSIVISNLTDLWLQIGDMNKTQIAGLGLHMIPPARGVYELNKKIPYYGQSGLNSGLILMNLTRMRAFDFGIQVVGIHTLYQHRMTMHDQDIFNIIFHNHPDMVMPLGCTYSFYSLHCGGGLGKKMCIFETIEGPRCFCNDSLTKGIHLVNGNGGNFLRNRPKNLFNSVYSIMTKFDLLRGSYPALIETLMDDFNSLYYPCFSLTAEMMYKNMQDYFQKSNLI